MKVLAEIEETAKMDSLPSIGPIKGKIVEGVIKEHKPRWYWKLEHCMIFGILIPKLYQIAIWSKNFDTDTKYNKPIVISVEKGWKLATIARKNVKNSRLSNLIK